MYCNPNMFKVKTGIHVQTNQCKYNGISFTTSTFGKVYLEGFLGVGFQYLVKVETISGGYTTHN